VLLELPATVRDLARMAEIAAVLARYGFGDAVQRVGLAGALERAGRALHWPAAAELARLEAPERMRRALQDLGPVFVKLGQLLATRVDLFPPEWIAELEKLQDQAPPADPAAVRAQLLEDLGAPPEELFLQFDAQPIAGGSIAQVHRARLAAGEDAGAPVAVKVRRPGIETVVDADLSLLARLAQLVEARLPDLARFRPREVVRQFTRTLRAELDLAGECRSAERIARSFRDDPGIVVPKVYWTWTSARVNVQSFIEGIPSRDLGALDRAGLDRALLARRGARAMLKMVIEDGFFHADPHFGNVFYLPGERVAFIDFGMTGRLTPGRRDELVQLLDGLVERDAAAVVDVLLDWSRDASVDGEALTADVDAFIDRYHGRSLAQVGLGAMLADLVRVLQEHRLALPPDLALVLKVAATLEATGRELDPGFDMVGEAEPFLRAATLARRGPAALARRGWRAARAALDLVARLPGDLQQMVRRARDGRLQVHVDVTGLERFGRQLDGAASRLTIGVVTAALIVGSSIVMTVEGGPTLLGLPLFGFAGFVGAVLGALWVLLSIWRSGRRR
jgi:ubiquinone biosynthesis protein